MPQESNAEGKLPPGAPPGPEAESDAEPCRTTLLVPSFSVCLKKDRLCPHALSFGHQYLCRHPDHAEFAVAPWHRDGKS